MALSCAQMIDRVLERVGRKHTTSTFKLDDVILDALNEAQRKIVRRCPHVLELQLKDTTYCKAETSRYEYDLSDIDPPISHLRQVWVMNGRQTHRVTFKGRKAFDAQYPDPSAESPGVPTYYTQMGHMLIFSCPFSTDYDGLPLRLDYCQWATPFESVESEEISDIENADQGLMYYAEAEALRSIARGNASVLATAQYKEGQFREWLTELQSYHDLQTEDTTGDGYHVLEYEEN